MSISRTVSSRFETQLNTPPETSACQKLVIILSLGTFIALASLIAALPLELRSHQPSQEPSADDDYQGDHGSNAWLIVATIIGMLAGPAVAYLFVNLYNRTSPVLIHAGILIASVITFLWVLFTYSLVWGKDAWGDQILGFPGTYYMFRHTGSNVETSLAGTPASIFAVFELAFPIVSALIVASAIIDRVNVYGLLTFIIVWHICIWCPIAHIVWNQDGFFMKNQIIDFSGGIVVNMLSGVTILVLNFYLDWKQAPKHEANGVKDSEGLLVQVLGLWFVNFALNAGKAHSANAIACQSIVNTIAGVMTSILLNFFWDQVFDVPYTVVAITNAILVGLVSTSPSSGYVTVGGAMVVSAFTVLVTRIIAKWILKDGLNDKPYSTLTIYGVAGTTGFLFTALMAYKFVNPAGQNGLTFGWQTPIRHHTAAILAIWFCTIIPLFIAVFIVDLFVPLSRAEQPKGDFAPTNIGPFRAESVSLNTDGIYKQNSGVQGANTAEQTA